MINRQTTCLPGGGRGRRRGRVLYDRDAKNTLENEHCVNITLSRPDSQS